jgi:hypothetical protein
MADALPNGARQLIVGPIACAGFRIRSDVRGHDAAGKIAEPHDLANAFAARQYRRAYSSHATNGSRCIRWKK